MIVGCLLVLRRAGYGPPQVHYLGKTATFILLLAFPVLLLGKATAKELLGEASRRAVDEDRPLRDVLDELSAVTDVLTPAALDALLDPTGYTGAARTRVDRALGDGVAAGEERRDLG